MDNKDNIPEDKKVMHMLFCDNRDSNVDLEKINEFEMEKEMLSRVKPEELELLQKEFQDIPDVCNSLKKYADRVYWTHEECCVCGGRVVKMYFRNADHFWENLAGREGVLRICSFCKKFLTLDIHIMN